MLIPSTRAVGRPVELEQNAERDHLTLGCGEQAERRLERTRPEGEILRLGKVAGVAFLPAAASLLGAKVVEGGRPRDAAEPGSRGSSARVESAPDAKSLLEGLAGQVFRDGAVAGEEEEVAMDRVELRFGDRREGRPVEAQRRPRGRHRVHDSHTPRRARIVTSRSVT